MADLILIASLVVSAFNTGLVWLVQLVHYPGFARIGEKEYKVYQTFHMQAITFIVAPSMLLELGLAVCGLFFLDQLPSPIWYLIAVMLVILIWINTAFWAVPAHRTLATEGFNKTLIQKLVSINWWRTLAWSLKTSISTYLVYELTQL